MAVTQASEKPDGKQARLQLEDMLTRIEMHFQVNLHTALLSHHASVIALIAIQILPYLLEVSAQHLIGSASHWLRSLSQ